MPDWLAAFLSSGDFMPHGHCYLWNPALVWLHVISDALIALAYISIPITLVNFVRKRKDIPFNWMFVCFGIFIIACGATHVMEIWTLWTPTYWLAGVIKAITAAASVPTAILLARLMPKALAMPTLGQWQQAHQELSRAHAALEERVAERTAELTQKNLDLAQEIHERRQAEEAFRESEALNTAVMEAALDAIVVMDHLGTIREFNPAAEGIFGYSRSEAIGRSLGELIIPSSLRAQHESGLQRYLEAGVEQVLGRRIEVPALRRDGTEFPAEVAVVRIHSEGKPVFTGYIRDITYRRQAAEAEALRRAKEAAEEANGELEAFSYSVAHDLRAPLRAINGFSSALREDWGPSLDAAAQKDLNRIIAAADRMAELIDALLALARLTRTEPRRETADLSLIARKVVAQLQAAEPTRVVEWDIADDLVEQGDPQLVQSLLENLLGNAWKFTSKVSSARIEVGRVLGEGVMAYYVKDNGAGFDMKLAEKLYAPFRRLHTAHEFEGTGIGLATVQRIVRRHGGKVWAEAVENEGATFYFTLSSEGAKRSAI